MSGRLVADNSTTEELLQRGL